MLQAKLPAGFAIALLATTTLGGGAARAAVINSVSVFASGPAGAARPDSITVGGGSVFVAYAGGTLDNANQLVTVDASGTATPFFTGVGSAVGALASPHGLDFVATAVPEPATLMLMGTGMAALLVVARRRRQG